MFNYYLITIAVKDFLGREEENESKKVLVAGRNLREFINLLAISKRYSLVDLDRLQNYDFYDDIIKELKEEQKPNSMEFGNEKEVKE